MTVPKPLRTAYDLWMRFAHVLGRIMSFILLTILWLTIFALYAVVIKLVHLFRKKSPSETYWIDVSTESSDLRHQF